MIGLMSRRSAPRHQGAPSSPDVAREAGWKRDDIQGLRALAVLLVIGDHVFGQPVGGFIGVDVFFVLSGFLITGLLVREHQRHGRISYLDFYRRRVRRIVPVATLVLVVTIAAAYVIFNEARGEGVARDSAWAFAFLANWHFADIGTDYFLGGGPVSPVQHYWSLSVEEQFYVVWPTAVAAVLWLGRRRTTRTSALAIVTVLALAASFGYSLWHSMSDPTAAYFSTVDRAWELLVGALLAVTVPLLRRIPDVARPLLAWSGLGLIVLAVLVVSEDRPFPAPWAALPVFGTALVVAAGAGGTQRLLAPLVNPVMRYIGDISYSLYLWHFPVVVLGLAYAPDGGIAYQASVLAITGVLSVISYHLVEDPIRRSSWLEPRWRRSLSSGPTNHSRRLANGWLAVGLLVALPMTFLALNPSPPAAGERILAEAPSGTGQGAPDGGTPEGSAVSQTGSESNLAYLQERLAQSLRLEDFPALAPAIDDLGIESWYEEMKATGCLSVPPGGLDQCVFGNPAAEPLAVVVGDSFAISYMPAIRAALGETFRIQQLTLQECPVWDAPTTHLSGAPYPECPAYRSWSWDEVDRLDPDLVIMATSHRDVGALVSRATGQEAVTEVEKGLTASLRRLSGPDRLLVMLAPPPGARDLQTCVTSVGSPDDCETEIDTGWYDATDLEKVVADEQGVAYVDTKEWFCVEQYCPAFVGTTPAYADGSHLTLEFSRQLGPVMYDALAAAAAARPSGG
ncbi:acyltransferase family protein [Nocardioides sp.]|uniref:acyltransferase family protein n=1 Tax=Nocardioides sp. TaxID=35761 RepID=UPI00286B7276|nr:acyltransferase family protein [Nocardioides sp.]